MLSSTSVPQHPSHTHTHTHTHPFPSSTLTTHTIDCTRVVQSSPRTLLISSNQLTLKLCCLFPVFVLVSKYIYTLLLLCALCACMCVPVCVCFICCRNLCALCVLIYLRLVWFQGEIRKNNVRIEKYILCRYYTHTQMYVCICVWGTEI